MGWFEHRFAPRETAVETQCQTCGRAMWLPPSKVGRYKTCGKGCAFGPQRAAVQSRTRPCLTCQKEFTPRANQLRVGQGRFCSQKCNTAAREAMLAPEATERRLTTMRAMRDAGQINYRSGEDNPSWKGGQEAFKERRRQPEKRQKANASMRAYRARNQHKVREWRTRRDNGKVLPRLPHGTIPRIGAMQKWRCAICRVPVQNGYHVDHIMPIARGGKHLPRNLQLLCATCNLRKNAKDPIAYMQELGRLL